MVGGTRLKAGDGTMDSGVGSTGAVIEEELNEGGIAFEHGNIECITDSILVNGDAIFEEGLTDHIYMRPPQPNRK